MIKDIKNQSDYFFPPIPRWVTHYGFGIMVLLLIGFLLAASQISYVDIQQFDVVLTKNSQTAKLDFNLYKKLKSRQPIMVDGPFQRPLKGYLQKQIIDAKDTYVIVPVVFSDTAINPLPITGQLLCKGSLRISRGSLLRNLVNAQ